MDDFYGKENESEEQNSDAGSLSGVLNLSNRFQNFGKGASQEALKEGSSQMSKESGKQAGEEIAKETGKESAKEAGKESAKEAVKEGGKQAAKATAETAAASTGVGAVAVVAEKAATLGLDMVSKTSEELSGYSIKLTDIIICIVLFNFLFMYIIICGLHGNVGASSGKYHADQYIQKVADSAPGGMAKKLLFFFFDTGEFESIGEYQPFYPLEESLEKNVEIIDNAFEISYDIAEIEIEEIITDKGYDYDLTMNSFYENGDPFETVNYAELISIISQKDTYNVENIKFKDLKALFSADLSNEKLKYLYCMNVEESTKMVTFYVNAEDGHEYRISEGEVPPEDGDSGDYSYEKELTYGKVILKHYDLKSLYEMLELDPNESNTHWKVNNVDMIDSQEKYLRFYSRDFDLGPSERTVWAWGFGRGDITLSEREYYELIEFLELYDGDNAEAIKKVIEYAFSKLGTAYSQANRLKEGYFDCSSFVAACYRQIGVQFGGYAPVAADICKYLTQTGHCISNGYTTDMQPGDLIFYSSSKNGRYKNITHVALYVGNGKIIDASYSKGQVVYRNIWGKNQIVAVCRPLSSE